MQFPDEEKIKLRVGVFREHKFSTLREMVLLAAKLSQTLSPKVGRREALGVCWKASGQVVNTHPLMCRPAQLRGPSPEESFPAAEGVSWPIKGPPKGSPDPAPEHQR